jgi:Lrp/AsnC family leucine-responsive transcriptional regulator
VDFVAVGQFRDINHYREFMLAELIGDENIKRQNSTIAVDRLRFNLELEFLLET